MGGQTHPHSFRTMTFVDELAVVATETTVVKKAITKTLARTQTTAAKKKKPAKKAAKAKKPKKAKKERKKNKAKKVRFPGGKRRKGQHKSKAMKAAGKKSVAALRKAGKGIFKAVSCSGDLQALGCKAKMPRTEAVKAIWAYIKKNKLNKGRTISPDAKLGAVIGAKTQSMFAMTKACSKH